MTQQDESLRSFGDVDDAGQDEQFAPDPEAVYDDLVASLNNEEENLRSFTVPSRNDVEAVFSVNIEFDLLRAWSKRAVDRRKKESDPMKLAMAIMTNTTRGIKMRGIDITAQDGSPLTLVHPEFVAMTKTNSPQQAIRKFYGSDGHVLGTMAKILEAAGYDDDDIEVGDSDPLNQN